MSIMDFKQKLVYGSESCSRTCGHLMMARAIAIRCFSISGTSKLRLEKSDGRRMHSCYNSRPPDIESPLSPTFVSNPSGKA